MEPELEPSAGHQPLVCELPSAHLVPGCEVAPHPGCLAGSWLLPHTSSFQNLTALLPQSARAPSWVLDLFLSFRYPEHLWTSFCLPAPFFPTTLPLEHLYL